MAAINNTDFTTLSIIFLAALLLLVTLYHAWKTFKLLLERSSFPNYVWVFPKYAPKTPTDITKAKIPLTIKLPENSTVANKTVYPIIVHGDIGIGFLFFYFLKIQYNYGLMLTSKSSVQEQGWEFYLVSKSGKRKLALNPDQTIRENGIKENAVIEAVRITEN